VPRPEAQSQSSDRRLAYRDEHGGRFLGQALQSDGSTAPEHGDGLGDSEHYCPEGSTSQKQIGTPGGFRD
jgi:hypothetical protein